MAVKDPRIDAYIAGAPDYAQPVLHELRARIHRHCPQVEEAIKWRSPYFLCDGMLGGMAAFKHYCSFGFWREKALLETIEPRLKDTLARLGRFNHIEALPADSEFGELIQAALRLNRQPSSRPSARKPAQPRPVEVPAELAAALRSHALARATFEAFSPSHQREYCEWIAEAKRPETRERRLKQALEWLAEGKSRNWKYERCNS